MKRWNSIPYYLAVLAGSLGSSACTPLRSADAQSNSPKLTVEAVSDIGVDTGASYYAEVDFEKGKASLAAKDSKAIHDLIDRSLRTGDLKEVKVLGFSDQSFNSESQPDFFKHQKKLADSRNENIKKYLEINYPQVNVQIYNMVAHPTVVEELVGNSDANVRKTFEEAGMMIGNNLNSCAPKIVSKALIVSIIKKNKE